MKYLLSAILLAVIPFCSFAQSGVKQKEVSVGLSGFGSIGFAYKVGNPTGMWRLASFSFGYSDRTSEFDLSKNTSSSSFYGLQVGREWRKILSEKIEFRYGADLAFRYSTNVNETQSKLENRLDNNKTETYSPGANLVLGFNYLISEDLILGIEFLPSFFYEIGESESKTKIEDSETIRKSDNSGFNFGISSTAVLFTLTYRIRKNNL